MFKAVIVRMKTTSWPTYKEWKRKTVFKSWQNLWKRELLYDRIVQPGKRVCFFATMHWSTWTFLVKFCCWENFQIENSFITRLISCSCWSQGHWCSLEEHASCFVFSLMSKVWNKIQMRILLREKKTDLRTTVHVRPKDRPRQNNYNQRGKKDLRRQTEKTVRKVLGTEIQFWLPRPSWRPD